MMGGAGVLFVTNKTDAVKFEPAPLVERIGKTETANAVQTTQIETLIQDVGEIKTDVKEIKDLFYQQLGYKKPAFEVPKNAPKITGVKINGEPQNE